MKIAIYRSDKQDLCKKIADVLYSDSCGETVPGNPNRQAAQAVARIIVNLLEQEGVWDHVIED